MEFSRCPLHLTLGRHDNFPKLLMLGWYRNGAGVIEFVLILRRRRLM